MFIYILATVDDENAEPALTIHQSERQAYECIWEAYLTEDLPPDASNDEISEAVVNVPFLNFSVVRLDFNEGKGIEIKYV